MDNMNIKLSIEKAIDRIKGLEISVEEEKLIIIAEESKNEE